MAPFPSAGTGSSDAGAEAEQAQRPVDRGMALLAGDDPDAGRTDKPVALDVPSGSART